MMINFLLALAAGAAAVLVYIALQPSGFRITREIRISAPAGVIFAQVNDLHRFEVWNPWSKLDPQAKNSFVGPDAGVGASMSWHGNARVDQGCLTVVGSTADRLVRMRLDYAEPFESTSMAEFTFTEEGSHTVVSWTLSGHNAFLPKVLCTLFISLEKAVGEKFEEGLARLKSISESRIRK